MESRPIGLDDETPLGYRARDIVTEAVFSEHLPFEWYRPEASRTQVRVNFELDLDGARWVSGDGCPGFVAIDAEILIATDDAKIEATFAGVLKVEGAQRASFSAGVPIAQVRGTFDGDAVVDSDQLVDPELRLQLHIGPGEVGGQLFLGGRDPNPNDSTIPTSPSLGAF